LTALDLFSPPTIQRCFPSFPPFLTLPSTALGNRPLSTGTSPSFLHSNIFNFSLGVIFPVFASTPCISVPLPLFILWALSTHQKNMSLEVMSPSIYLCSLPSVDTALLAKSFSPCLVFSSDSHEGLQSAFVLVCPLHFHNRPRTSSSLGPSTNPSRGSCRFVFVFLGPSKCSTRGFMFPPNVHLPLPFCARHLSSFRHGHTRTPFFPSLSSPCLQ